MALENANKVLSYIQWIFNTGPYGDPALKIKISKIGLRHVGHMPWSAAARRCACLQSACPFWSSAEGDAALWIVNDPIIISCKQVAG